MKKFVKFALYVLAGWAVLFLVVVVLALGFRWLGFGVILVALATAIGIPVLFAVYYLVKYIEKTERRRLIKPVHSDDD